MHRVLIRLGIVVEVLLLLAVRVYWRQSVSEVSNPINTTTDEKQDYIKWVDFQVTSEAMKQAYTYDKETCGKEIHIKWIDLLAYLGAKYGGDFSSYTASDMKEAAELLLSGEKTTKDFAAESKYFTYYQQAYGAVLEGLVGEYQIQELNDNQEMKWVSQYGLKGFSPIAKGFPYSDYDDFGVSRSYGYQRNHLGHDMMGQVGTPIIAVESGVVDALGWNQYGGWRIGISSFDRKRYYYYAHLRQNFPYAKWIKEGSVVQAGDVIGYMGRTGYSKQENTNNIDTCHLHFGLQLVFDESQREGNGEIWVSGYELVRFLYQNQCETVRDDATKEWHRVYQIRDPEAEKFQSAATKKK